ncbi:CgeB family protein [Micromonospora eburnea]|uniref:Spore maturation protein CgeB n=1 Tax=Micromonospora eburnea TaxID=227316 RepID=A0A1C6U428_9ACTN|nr:glycosyltransferase [Micromonospora eburnea]SCL48792.1 spore maturation protein CgeB [Micromonospora eburnea]
MRIGIIGPSGPDHFAENVSASLSRMGHDVVLLGSTHPERGGYIWQEVAATALRASRRVEARAQRHLARRALEHECDAVISTDSNLTPNTVSELRRNKVPVALWFPDCVANLGRQRMLAAPYTALFFKDPLLVRRLVDMLDAPACYLPEACNPQVHRPIGEAGAQRRIVIVGNTYPSRMLLVRRLIEADVPLAIYGAPPARDVARMLPRGIHQGRVIVGEAKSRVFRTAAGVLNNLHPAEMQSVNCRLFEATAAGAAVLCERREVLPDMFDPDREVVPFTTFAELLERVRELLDDPRRTAEVGDAASKRAHSEHTYENRLPVVLDRLA